MPFDDPTLLKVDSFTFFSQKIFLEAFLNLRFLDLRTPCYLKDTILTTQASGFY